MRPIAPIAAATAALLTALAAAPPAAGAQGSEVVRWRVMSARRRARADTLFGRFWRSHASIIRVFYSERTNTTSLRTPDRGLSWEPGSTRLVRVEPVIRIAGRHQTVDSAELELTLSFADSIYRTPGQAALELVINDTLHMPWAEPQVDYPMATARRGIPLIVTVTLTRDQSLALAGARWLTGTTGPFPFSLKNWKLWEIKAIYRASFCGIEQ